MPPQFVALFFCRPISGDFALVPRAFAERYFSAVSAFHSCDAGSWPPREPWWQPDCGGGGGFQESVLFRHLHANDVAYRPYPMFDYYIVQQPQRKDGGGRGGGGGGGDGGGERGDIINVCNVRTAAEHDTACVLLGAAGLLASSYSRCVGSTRSNRLEIASSTTNPIHRRFRKKN